MGEGFKTLVPHVIGHTEKAEARKGGVVGRRWDAESIIAAARQNLSQADAQAVERILTLCKDLTVEMGYGRGQVGSFSPKFTASPRSFFTLRANGDLQLNLEHHDDLGGIAVQRRGEFVTRLRDLGFTIPEGAGYPTLRMSKWTPHVESIHTAIAEVFGAIGDGVNISAAAGGPAE